MLFKIFYRIFKIKKKYMSRAVDCYLLPCDNTLSKISIPSCTEVIVGRSRETSITDRHCSKKQLSLVADYEKSEISIKCIGSNPAAVNGKLTKKNITYIIKDRSIIDVVAGSLKYSVIFKYVTDSESTIIKRTRGEEPDEVVWKQRKMDECKAWKDFDKVLHEYTTPNFVYKNKVASFDLDSTLIKTKSGHTFPKDPNDWTLWTHKIKSILSKLHKEDYMLVIFTNQAGLSSYGNAKLPGFRSKIENIVSELGVPMKVLISTSYGLYRKPAPGMWIHLVKNAAVDIKKEDSFYVGDAAGRENNWKPGKKKDFSISDRLFALNLNLKFYTPEEYFFGESPVIYPEIPFIPSDFCLIAEPDYKVPSLKQEVIVMVGSPASGKSNFVNNKLVPYGYINVSRDNLGSWQKCVRDLENELSVGKNVVIDNTNPDAVSRGRYIQLCKKLKVPVRCFVMDCSLERALHNNAFRTIIDKAHQVVTASIIKNFFRLLEVPVKDEGFSEIIYVPFLPHFSSDKDKELYFCYLTSK